jgi:hypothetical protein
MTKKQISALICVHLRLMNLKKQTQFLNGQNGITSYLKRGYGNNPPAGSEKNKANLSLREQTQSLLAPSTAGGGLKPT